MTRLTNILASGAYRATSTRPLGRPVRAGRALGAAGDTAGTLRCEHIMVTGIPPIRAKLASVRRRSGVAILVASAASRAFAASGLADQTVGVLVGRTSFAAGRASSSIFIHWAEYAARCRILVLAKRTGVARCAESVAVFAQRAGLAITRNIVRIFRRPRSQVRVGSTR